MPIAAAIGPTVAEVHTPLIETGYQEAKRILQERNEEWERLAQGLLEYETLTGDEIKKVMAGEALGGDDDEDKPSGDLPSVTALPKTSRAKKTGGDAAPEPSA